MIIVLQKKTFTITVMKRFRFFDLLPLCIGCLCWLSCANNSVSGLAKKHEKQGRHIDGAYEQLGYILCSDSKTQYYVSKEEVLPIATMGEMIQYRVPSYDQRGSAVFNDKEEKITSLSHLSPVGNIGIKFTMNNKNLIYVFKSAKYYALSVNSCEDPTAMETSGRIQVDLDTIYPFSSQLSDAARNVYSNDFQHQYIYYDIYKDGRISLQKDNLFHFSGASPYLKDLSLPVNQLYSDNETDFIVKHIEHLVTIRRIRKNLLSLEQLAADYNSGNKYLADKKYVDNWYYVEVDMDRLSSSFSFNDGSISLIIKASFSYPITYNGNVINQKCNVTFESSDRLMGELPYPQSMIVKAKFTGATDSMLSDDYNSFNFENTRPLYYRLD